MGVPAPSGCPPTAPPAYDQKPQNHQPYPATKPQYQYPTNQHYPTTNGIQAQPTPQHVTQAYNIQYQPMPAPQARFDSGARFDGNSQARVPPPPPGVQMNSAQIAAAQGQSVQVGQKKGSFLTGGDGGGVSMMGGGLF